MQESGEMYLETILILSGRQALVRAIDVSDYMNYSKPSVSRALGLLKQSGHILVDSASGAITLTKTGLERANKIPRAGSDRRHAGSRRRRRLQGRALHQ